MSNDRILGLELEFRTAWAKSQIPATILKYYTKLPEVVMRHYVKSKSGLTADSPPC